jgi:hypothetical protein
MATRKGPFSPCFCWQVSLLLNSAGLVPADLPPKNLAEDVKWLLGVPEIDRVAFVGHVLRIHGQFRPEARLQIVVDADEDLSFPILANDLSEVRAEVAFSSALASLNGDWIENMRECHGLLNSCHLNLRFLFLRLSAKADLPSHHQPGTWRRLPLAPLEKRLGAEVKNYRLT